MRLVSVIIGLVVLLGGGIAAAAPQAEYLAIGAPDASGGIPGGKLSWELRDSLGRYFNYRIGGNDQAGFRFKNEQWMVHNLATDTHSLSLLFDWHPVAGRFRVSGGLFSYKQILDYSVAPEVDEIFEYKIRIDPQDVVADVVEELGEEGVYVAKEDVQALLPENVKPVVITIRERIEISAEDLAVQAQVKYENIAPYFGFGWSNPFSSHGRLRYSFDIGVLYQIDPDIRLVLQGEALRGAEPAVQTLLDEWAFEQELKLGKKLDEYSIVPRIGFGLSYRLY